MEDSARHAARILARDREWLAAAARRDLDGMMAIYAPDASELRPALPVLSGREAIRAFYADLLVALPRSVHAFESHEILVAEAGDLAVVRGTYRFTPDSERPSQVQTGKFVGVWRQRDGDWQLLLDISNADARG